MTPKFSKLVDEVGRFLDGFGAVVSIISDRSQPGLIATAIAPNDFNS